MPNRDAVLLYQNAEADTATEVIDLDLPDPVSALDLEVECTNGASGNKGNYISDIVTKIEVVDGSDVLCSLNMAQLQALQFYKTGRIPIMLCSEYASGTQRETARLLFGRYLWDPTYALLPSRYRNPQLKVTFNKAAIRAAAADGFATGTNIKLTVAAKIMEGGPSPSAFLMQKEIKSFTSVGSGDERVDLPRDYPYRLMMLRAWLQGSDIDEIITNLKLTFDTDKFIPFNRKVQQLDAEAYELFGGIIWQHDIFRASQETVRTVLNKEPRVIPSPNRTDTAEYAAAHMCFSSQYYLNLWSSAGAHVTTAYRVHTLQEGHALHATLPVVFGLLMEPTTWLDATRHGKVEAVLSQGTVGAVVQIVLEQVRS